MLRRPTERPVAPVLTRFWNRSPQELATALGCNLNGLSGDEAGKRLARLGPNVDAPEAVRSPFGALLRRLLEPLALILLVAALVAAVFGDWIGGAIIAGILALSIGLDTVQEGNALKVAETLRRSVALKAEARRDGRFMTIPTAEVVPGDIIRVRAGDIVPADALILTSEAFTAVEAALTGEPYAVEKRPGPVVAGEPAEASNALFKGAVAQTGEALALVAATGRATMFGTAAATLAEATQASPFQKDLRDFGLVVARMTIALVVAVLALRVAFGRPVLDSLLFAVALAVGLTPELLPMITTVTLSRGALRMSARKVIVKRLAAIHDLGAMTILCTDKTGTLTSAEIALSQSLDGAGRHDPRPARLAAAAAALGGDRGSLDAALVRGVPEASAEWRLVARRAFDFTRRTGSVLARSAEGTVLIVKGAPEAVLPLCTHRRDDDALVPMDEADRREALDRVRAFAGEGLRCIAVATRRTEDLDERDLVFEGLCAFADPAKATAAGAIARLAAAGVSVKILSGDDPVVVSRLAGLVGLKPGCVLSGSEIERLSDDALAVRVREVDAYGRLSPDQKVRVVRALKGSGAVVGFLGDGINDAPALRQSDIGLSVEGATGVAQAAADMILLAPDLEVVADGVAEGRRTFANILKYVRMGASSNFGNMLSMAAASVALPFLPMLPTQILLNNLLYDLSEIGIPFDGVRPETVARPQVWDMSQLVRFAAIMGPLSSLFDLTTFALLLMVFGVSPDVFRTAWFLESMATQILVIVIIRTGGRPWRDRPGGALALSSLAALTVALVLPFTPVGPWFGFEGPPAPVLLAIAAITATYLILAELLKPYARGERPLILAKEPPPFAGAGQSPISPPPS